MAAVIRSAFFMYWFDDYLIGGFLLLSAWKTYTGKGNRFLIAAWGFSTGMAFSSFFSQLQRIDQPDPSGVSSASVAVVKGIMFLLCIICLVMLLQPVGKK